MWEIIRELVAGGVTIFLTTQYLEEADRLADRVAVLDHGRRDRGGHAGAAQAARPRRPTSGLAALPVAPATTIGIPIVCCCCSCSCSADTLAAGLPGVVGRPGATTSTT
jgi:energy-coupling factor transporter ATP-binding protein EcfA2